MNWKPGAGANANRTLRLMRKAQTSATEKYGIGGRLKLARSRRPIALPKLKFMEEHDDGAQ